MYNRHKLEKSLESDKASQDALKAQPAYKSVSKKFGMLHGLVIFGKSDHNWRCSCALVVPGRCIGLVYVTQRV